MVSRYFDYAALVAIVAVAVPVRLLFEQGIAPFVSKDSQSYFLPAWDLLRSGELQLGLRRTPGYPLFLTLVLAVVGDDLRRVALAQHLLGVGTAALTYLLGRLTFGWPVGLVGGLLVAISAPLLVYEHYILAEALFTFVLTAALVALTLGADRPQGLVSARRRARRPSRAGPAGRAGRPPARADRRRGRPPAPRPRRSGERRAGVDRLRPLRRALDDPQPARLRPRHAEHLRADADRADGVLRPRLRLLRS